MFPRIFCLSFFAVSALASVELHGALELPRAVQSLMESRRFKRQLGFDASTKCIASCAQNLKDVVKSLGMEQSATGLLNSRLYDAEGFNSFCEGMEEWSNCSQACPDSQTKELLVKALQPIESLCGEDREEFESYQACYRESDPQQNRACDPLCGGQDAVQEEMNKLQASVGDMDSLVASLNKACQMTSCQVDCRTPIIFAACKDKEAAFFLGKWVQKTMKEALIPLESFNLDIQCKEIVNFNPDKFDFDEGKGPQSKEEGEPVEGSKPEEGSKNGEGVDKKGKPELKSEKDGISAKKLAEKESCELVQQNLEVCLTKLASLGRP